MLLFFNDWLKYPNAIMDTQTKNRSFYNMAIKLRDMGIKNHAWPLALINPALQGIDPFSPNLSQEQIVMIGIEIIQNPWYFFREIARAPAISGPESTYVEANRSNLSLWWCFFNHITFILTQPRQTGKSFNTDVLMTYLYGIYCESTNISLLTKDDSLRTSNIQRLKDIYDELPYYLKLKTKDDVNNMETISLKAKNNWYKTYVPQSSPKAALKVGRGITTSIFHIDEPPFQPYIGISLPAALAAMGAATEKAKANNEPYGIIMTTTAGKKDDKDGKYVYEYIQEAALWSEHYYDSVDHADLEIRVRRNSRGSKPLRGVEQNNGKFRIYAVFSHIQLGKDNKWLASKLEESNAKGDDANRDFFNVWTSGTEYSPLDTHLLELINANIQSEKHQMCAHIGSYITRWYIEKDQIQHFMMTRKVVCGIDTSDASGGDDISFVLTDVLTGETVAVGNFNETNLNTFAQWLVWFLETYKNVTMVIERRSSGATIIDILLDLLPTKNIDPFTRLFNWVINDPYEHQSLYTEACQPLHKRSVDLYVRAKKFFGFATSGFGQTARSVLYSQVLQTAAKNCAYSIKDSELISQLSSLVIRNGRIDHPVGGHDDLVIGWLLTHWLLTMGKNLITYGINSSNILVDVKGQEKKSIEDINKNFEQRRVKEKIKTLLAELELETEEMIILRIEQQIRFLDSLTDHQLDANGNSLDALIRQAKDKRKGASPFGNYRGYQLPTRPW